MLNASTRVSGCFYNQQDAVSFRQHRKGARHGGLEDIMRSVRIVSTMRRATCGIKEDVQPEIHSARLGTSFSAWHSLSLFSLTISIE